MSPEATERERRRASLEAALEGAVLLGVELEPTYRVLSATIEPAPGRVRPLGMDPRLLLVAHPVSTLLAVLLETGGTGPASLRTFTTEQLPAVSAALGGATLTGPLLGRPEPRPGAWAPRWSLEGRSSAPDGTQETLTLRVEADDLRLGVFARCDVVELRRIDGVAVTEVEFEDRDPSPASAPPTRPPGGGTGSGA